MSGRSISSYGIVTPTSASNSDRTVDLIVKSMALFELVVLAAPSLGGKFQIDKNYQPRK